MVTEKGFAFAEAVARRYRGHVRSNKPRLSRG